MRVWIINHFAIPPSESGGTRHFSLARELIKQGISPTIIAAASNYQTGKARAMPEGASAHLETIEGVPFLWLRTATRSKAAGSRLIGMLTFAWQILSNLPGRTLEKPDVIFGSSPHLFAAAASCALARRLRVPFVLEVRDLWPESLVELGGYSPYHPVILAMKWLERYVYHHAARIVTLLPDAAPYFAARGAKAENVVIIPNGVDTDLLEPLSSLPLQGGGMGWGCSPPAKSAGEPPHPNLLPQGEKEFTILYAGTIGIPNQMETYIEAAAILKARPNAPKVKLRLVGEGIRKAALQTMAQELNVDDIVTFDAPVPKQQVPALLASADACYLQFKDAPLYQWGVSPNKLFDYLLAAKPVLYAANVRTNPITTANAGIPLKPGDAQGLADAIIKLASTSAEDRAAMGQRGREYVLSHHNFTTLGKKLADTLQVLKP